jgi:hypothetical protein
MRNPTENGHHNNYLTSSLEALYRQPDAAQSQHSLTMTEISVENSCFQPTKMPPPTPISRPLSTVQTLSSGSLTVDDHSPINILSSRSQVPSIPTILSLIQQTACQDLGIELPLTLGPALKVKIREATPSVGENEESGDENTDYITAHHRWRWRLRQDAKA